METISNVATAASRALFGETDSHKTAEQQSGTEPVSGVKGSGTTDDPYDGGNNEADPKLGGAPPTSTYAEPDKTTRKDDVVAGSGDSVDDPTRSSTTASNLVDPESNTRTGLTTEGPTSHKDDVLGGSNQSTSEIGRSSTTPSRPVEHEDGGLGQGLTTGDTDTTKTTGSTDSQGYSTLIGSKLDPHVSAPLGGSTTVDEPRTSGLGPNTATSTNPLSSQQRYDPTDLSSGGTPSNQSLLGQSSSAAGYTTGRSDVTSGDDVNTDYHRGSSAIGGDTSDRLVGQSDTPLGPSGGAAQGGVPQGINLPGAEVRPEHQTDKTGVTSLHHNDPKFSVEYPSSSNDASVADSGHSRGVVGGFGTVQPSVGADPSSGQKPLEFQQGADRPLDAPSEENTQAIREKKAVSEQALGDEDLLGAPGEAGPIGIRKQSERGTGQEWVRSTGYAAEGGDFDAAKPGAGKEADRLMDLHGVERSRGPGPIDPDEKVGGGLATKLKEKLHIGHHSG